MDGLLVCFCFGGFGLVGLCGFCVFWPVCYLFSSIDLCLWFVCFMVVDLGGLVVFVCLFGMVVVWMV